MRLADDWHKVEKWVSAACVSVTGAANAAWRFIGPFQQFIDQHLLSVISSSLLAVAFIAHFISTGKNDAGVSSETTGVSSSD